MHSNTYGKCHGTPNGKPMDTVWLSQTQTQTQTSSSSYVCMHLPAPVVGCSGCDSSKSKVCNAGANLELGLRR